MDNKHLYAVILAGGSGTRFWPLGRRSRPKQFLKLVGDRSLLDMTVARVRPLVPSSHIFIVTNKQYRRVIGRQLKKYHIPSGNILAEPAARNTAPAICWASAHIHRKDPQALTVVLPSDHLVLNNGLFARLLREAILLAQQDLLVTFGIVPHRPETGYGYLKTRVKQAGGRKRLIVEKFTEKPSLQKARRFIRSKNYFWNSGMFVWKAGVILDEFRRHLPGIHKALVPIPGGKELMKRFSRLPAISVDYGILEKAGNVAAVPAKGLGWSDLGSWESLYESSGRDKSGNFFLGDVISIGTRDSLVHAASRTVAVVGMDGCVIVDTPDALLVCPKDRSQEVRNVVDFLKGKNPALL